MVLLKEYTMTKKIQLSVLLGFALFGVSLTVQSQSVLKEDFQEGIPETFKVINNDSLTPNAAVNFITDSWVAYEDPIDKTNQVEISTSWYSPSGTSDDRIITPEIALVAYNTLNFITIALDGSFNDGFVVCISLTGDSISDFMANEPLLTVAGENNTWTDHTVKLAAAGYAETSVRLTFVNNSSNMYILTLDDIEVADVINHNLGVSVVQNPSEFASTPLNLTLPYQFATIVANLGANTLNDVKVDVQALKDNVEVFTPSKLLQGDYYQVRNC
jgi:hypothetical protein